MTELFRAVSDRLKAILTAHAAIELEADLITHHIERKTRLFRHAAELEEEGFADLAAELRRHAAALDPRKPAEAVLPALAHSTCPDGAPKGSLTTASATPADGSGPRLEPSGRKKAR